MLALFHTRSEDIMKPSFTIHPLAKSIIVQGMDGNSMKIKHFLIMLSPINAEEAEMEILSFISSLLIRNQESTEIFQSEDQERIGSYLAIQLHQFIKEKLTI
ncbi:PTS sugar transporter subunit IIA [Gracilibacillus sp. JCM 18860]